MKRFALLAMAIIFAAAGAAGAATVTLTFEWDPNRETNLAGYRLYASDTSGAHTRLVDGGSPILEVGKVTTCQDTIDIYPSEVVYYVLTAFNTEGQESGFSNEVSFFLPVPVPGEAPAPPKFRLNSWADASSK